MPRRLSIDSGNYYRITNTGAGGLLVFRTSQDRARFLQLLYLCNSSDAVVVRDMRMSPRTLFAHARTAPLCSVGAYALLPHSIDLVVYEHTPGGIGRFMQKVMTGYSMYMQRQLSVRGRIFAGSYRAELLSSEVLIKEAIVDVHLSPLDLNNPDWKERGIEDISAAKRCIEHYQYSSFLDYTGDVRPQRSIVDGVQFANFFNEVGGEKALVRHLEQAFGV